MSHAVQYVLPEEIRNAEKCLFKLSFGEQQEKYFIFKALKLRPVVQSLAEQIYREYNNPKENSLLYKVVCYYKKHRPGTFYVSLISKKGMAVDDLLVLENKTLKQAENDVNCLNPHFDNTKMFPRWVSHADIVSFKQKLKGITPSNRRDKLDAYLSQFVKNKANRTKIIAYIKRNFM